MQEEQAALHKTLRPATTHAQPAGGVQDQALWTLAAEGALQQMQRPLGQTPGKTSTTHSHLGAASKEKPELEAPRELLPRGSGHHVVLGEVGKLPGGLWEDPGYQGGKDLPMTSRGLSHHDTWLVPGGGEWRAEVIGGGVTFAAEPLHAALSLGHRRGL